MSFRINFFTDCLRCLSIVVIFFQTRFPGVFVSRKGEATDASDEQAPVLSWRKFFIGRNPINFSLPNNDLLFSLDFSRWVGTRKFDHYPRAATWRGRASARTRALRARFGCDDTCFSTSRVLRSLWPSSRSRSPIELRHLPRPRTKTSEARMQTGRARTTLPLRPSPSDPSALRRLRLRPGPRCNRT